MQWSHRTFFNAPSSEKGETIFASHNSFNIEFSMYNICLYIKYKLNTRSNLIWCWSIPLIASILHRVKRPRSPLLKLQTPGTHFEIIPLYYKNRMFSISLWSVSKWKWATESTISSISRRISWNMLKI